MQNVHGKEIDLLRTTVKIPGKRPPRAVATVAPTASPKTNGLTKDRSTLQLGIGNTGTICCPYLKADAQSNKRNCASFAIFIFNIQINVQLNTFILDVLSAFMIGTFVYCFSLWSENTVSVFGNIWPRIFLLIRLIRLIKAYARP